MPKAAAEMLQRLENDQGIGPAEKNLSGLKKWKDLLIRISMALIRPESVGETVAVIWTLHESQFGSKSSKELRGR